MQDGGFLFYLQHLQSTGVFKTQATKKHDRLLEVANNYFRFRPFLAEKISQYKDEYGHFRLMYMNQEIKKIYKMVLENTWPQYMLRKNGGYVH